MKKLFILIVPFIFSSCFDQARVKIIKTGAVITTDALTYSDLKAGDTVQFEKMNLDWEINNQEEFPKDTFYCNNWKDGNDSGFYCMEKSIGVIQRIK